MDVEEEVVSEEIEAEEEVIEEEAAEVVDHLIDHKVVLVNGKMTNPLTIDMATTEELKEGKFLITLTNIITYQFRRRQRPRKWRPV